MSSSNFIALGSVVISLGALAYTIKANTKRYELTGQYRNEILKWYSCCVELLITLRINCLHQNVNQEIKEQCLARLSAQIEIGRFYFPNIDKGDDFGQTKPLAYRGYRNAVLALLVYSYRIFGRDDAHKYKRHTEMLEKYFTSYVFDTIDPRKYLVETRRYTKVFFSKHLSIEDFLKQEPDAIETFLDIRQAVPGQRGKGNRPTN